MRQEEERREGRILADERGGERERRNRKESEKTGNGGPLATAQRRLPEICRGVSNSPS